MNLTGSPLKDDDEIDDLINNSIASKIHLNLKWNDNEEMYTPIDINKAREILMNVQEQTFPVDSRGSIFILCNDQTVKNSTFLLSTRIEEGRNVRGIGCYHGVVKHENKSIDGLLNRHLSFISPSEKLNAQLESIFEITPNVNLKFVNTAVNPAINHIDESSEVVLNQKVEIGRSHVLCEDFWSQIQLLNMIKQDIINFKNNSCDGTMSEPQYNYGSADLTFESLQEKVVGILSEVHAITEDTDGIVDTGLEAVIKRARQRQLNEVSEQLWDLLKFTNSYGDLKKIITFIFQTSSRSNIVNVPTSTCGNKFSELIRELSQQRLAIPHLVGTEPLELLLEIGIEKLMNDYEYILAESRICKLRDMNFGGGSSQSGSDKPLSVRKSLSAAAVDLNQSSRKTLLKKAAGSFESEEEDHGMKNSRFNERDVELNISKLVNLHLAVEHLLLIQNNLTMENDYATISKRLFMKPLIPFEDLPKFDKFEISINDKKVVNLVENLVPNAQKFVLHSSSKFKSIKSVFYFNIEQIVPPLAQKEKEDEVIDKSGDSFHFISFTTIASKF